MEKEMMFIPLKQVQKFDWKFWAVEIGKMLTIVAFGAVLLLLAILLA